MNRKMSVMTELKLGSSLPSPTLPSGGVTIMASQNELVAIIKVLVGCSMDDSRISPLVLLYCLGNLAQPH